MSTIFGKFLLLKKLRLDSWKPKEFPFSISPLFLWRLIKRQSHVDSTPLSHETHKHESQKEKSLMHQIFIIKNPQTATASLKITFMCNKRARVGHRFFSTNLLIIIKLETTTSRQLFMAWDFIRDWVRLLFIARVSERERRRRRDFDWTRKVILMSREQFPWLAFACTRA